MPCKDRLEDGFYLLKREQGQKSRKKIQGVWYILGMLKADILFILFYVIKTYSVE